KGGIHMSAAALPVFVEQPFLGLRNFNESDSLLFFGRGAQVEELLSRLEEGRFLSVVGLSGSGKSSLVRAGLIPALRKGQLPGPGGRWMRAVIRPGADPFAALADALNNDDTLGPDPARLATLRASSFGLIHAARKGRTPRQSLLVVVDQFEEIFRIGSADAAAFVRLLLTAAEESEPDYRIYVVITIRSDYLGECAQFRDLPAML